MSAFLYSVSRELYCLDLDNCGVKSGEEFKKIAAVYCRGIPANQLSIVHNGRLVYDDSELCLQPGDVCRAVLCLPGGKGGFGSMLRAIGAQIEKTTNREACRDLSGRRMRDINDEKKIAEWVSKQADREREKARQRQERLDKRYANLRNHTFDDQAYTRNIQENSGRIEDALQQGLRVVTSSTSSGPSTSSDKTGRKRLHPDECTSTASGKKSRIWLGMDHDSDSDEEELDGLQSVRNEEASPCSSTVTCTMSKLESSTAKERDCILESCSDSGTEKAMPNAVTPNPHPRPAKPIANRTKEETSSSEITNEDHLGSTGGSEHKVLVKPAEVKREVCLDFFSTAEDLESLGLECLKGELLARGLKCGGTLKQRAQRLFATKGVPLDQLDPALFAKPIGGKRSNRNVKE